MLPQLFAQQLNYAALVLPDFGAFANRELLPACSDNGARLSAKKGVAPDLLATLDRLQQEGVFLRVRRYSEKRRRVSKSALKVFATGMRVALRLSSRKLR